MGSVEVNGCYHDRHDSTTKRKKNRRLHRFSQIGNSEKQELEPRRTPKKREELTAKEELYRDFSSRSLRAALHLRG
jgi:hypothetical protein